MFGIIFLLKCSFVNCHAAPGQISNPSALCHMYWSLTLSWCSFLMMNLTAYLFLRVSPFPLISIFIANLHIIFWHFKCVVISFMDNILQSHTVFWFHKFSFPVPTFCFYNLLCLWEMRLIDGCNNCSSTGSAVSILEMLSDGERYIHWHSILELVLASSLPITKSFSDSLNVPSSPWTTFPILMCLLISQISFTIPRLCSSPWRCVYFDAVMEFAWSNDHESCASTSIAVCGASKTEQVEDDCSCYIHSPAVQFSLISQRHRGI